MVIKFHGFRARNHPLVLAVDRDTISNNVHDIMSFDNYYIDQSEIMFKDITIIKREKASLSGCQR